jgi:hypothetical protein
MLDLTDSLEAWRHADTWANELRSFFGARAVELADVLTAGGCREGWIQGEAFRHFRRERGLAFYCNAHPVPYGKAADFAVYDSHEDDADLLFLAELKVLGSVNYQPKNITGRGADAKRLRALLRSRGDLVVTARQYRHAMEINEGSLVRDYFRIIHAKETDSVVRALLLVLDLRGTPDTVGEVLRAIEFEHRARTIFASADFIVKAWFLRGPGAGAR